jgi:hypothetical protein
MGFSLKSVGKKLGGMLFGSNGSTGGTPDIGYLRSGPNPYEFLMSSDPSKNISERYFNDYTANINAPSSVDAVRSGMNQEQLDLMLGNIQRDTNTKFGSDISNYFGRGLIDPGVGVSSDISGNALAQTAAEGARTAAGARLSYSLQDLERQAAKEKALRDAYQQRYGYGQANALAYANETADRDELYAKLLSGNFNDAQTRKNATAKGGAIDAFFSNFGQSYGNSSGNTAGSNEGGATKYMKMLL